MLAIDRSELQRGADGHFSGAVVWSGHNMSPSPFLVLPSILEESVIQGVHAVAAALTFDERPDSVDGHPAHEFYVIKDGVIQEDAHALAELLQPALHTLRQHADRSPICASSARGRCTPCTCLIRRYRPFERRSHYEHVDGHAAVTAVVSLSRRSGYQGGLFLSNLTTRWWLPLDDGEAVVHASDLFHGVHVTEGERWSLVVWFRTCARCTMAGAGDWYLARAVAGEPFGAFLHASRASQALTTALDRDALAARWYNVSAHGGFAPAQHLLGNAYAVGKGLPVDLKLAAAWLERAVAGGSLRRAVAGGSMPSEALGGTQRFSEVLAEHADTSGCSARRADREAVPRTAFSAAPIGTGSAAGSTPVMSAVVSADGTGSAAGSTPVVSAVVSADGTGPSGGPSVGSRAAYDLARLLLRGVEFGWPSPLPESSQDPCVRAAELLTAAAADGHVRARAELSANKGTCELRGGNRLVRKKDDPLPSSSYELDHHGITE
jgi:TPR repeat protein